MQEEPPSSRTSLQDVLAATTACAIALGAMIATSANGQPEPRAEWFVAASVAMLIPSGIFASLICLTVGWRNGLKFGAAGWLLMVALMCLLTGAHVSCQALD